MLLGTTHPDWPEWPMRRTNQAMTSLDQVEALLHRVSTLRLGLAQANIPYVMPLTFAYEGGALYMHSGRTGRKIALLRENPKVCFEVEDDVRLSEPSDPNAACDFSMRYQSVIGFGKAAVHEDEATVARGLDLLMARFSERDFTYPQPALARTAMIVVTIDMVTGKMSGYD